MHTVKFTKQDMNNLKIFLSRTSLTGQEVPAYTKIIQAIYEAEQENEVYEGVPKKVGD